MSAAPPLPPPLPAFDIRADESMMHAAPASAPETPLGDDLSVAVGDDDDVTGDFEAEAPVNASPSFTRVSPTPLTRSGTDDTDLGRSYHRLREESDAPRERQYSQDDTHVAFGVSPKMVDPEIAHGRRRPSHDESSSRRSASFGRGLGRRSSLTDASVSARRRARLSRAEMAFDMMQAPAVPSMPQEVDDDPVRYAQCMRLLWLAASMKSFDVVVCLLPADYDNIEMCQLVSDMVPMLQYTRKRDPSPPQVVVALHHPAEAAEDLLELTPVSGLLSPLPSASTSPSIRFRPLPSAAIGFQLLPSAPDCSHPRPSPAGAARARPPVGAWWARLRDPPPGRALVWLPREV